MPELKNYILLFILFKQSTSSSFIYIIILNVLKLKVAV